MHKESSNIHWKMLELPGFHFFMHPPNLALCFIQIHIIPRFHSEISCLSYDFKKSCG